ncbi:MAG: hypothetical protein A2046_03180 [Bacteroidetes bacterium GWA2_30_7]|nr:MAG: hypothetical protein A2046_03180 [Bacteroidetes bacterium GWA2_30_7]
MTISKTFNIADINIEISWNPTIFNLYFSNQFLKFSSILSNNECYKIKIISINKKIPFERNNKNNWKISKLSNNLFSYQLKSFKSEFLRIELLFSLKNKIWELFYYNYDNIEPIKFNPFIHPLGSLIIQNIILQNNGFFIHGSAVNYKSKGLIFTGKSGTGKTTISNIYKKSGYFVIHNDRLIIRKIDNSYMMFNSPMLNVTNSTTYHINKIFSIYHSSKNEIKSLNKIETYKQIIPNIIQHNIDNNLIVLLSDTYTDFLKCFDFYTLGFVPDNHIIDFIDEHISK